LLHCLRGVEGVRVVKRDNSINTRRFEST
jgi:hypothetical protein